MARCFLAPTPTNDKSRICDPIERTEDESHLQPVTKHDYQAHLDVPHTPAQTLSSRSVIELPSFQLTVQCTHAHKEVVAVRGKKRNIISEVITMVIQKNEAIVQYVSRIKSWCVSKIHSTIAKINTFWRVCSRERHHTQRNMFYLQDRE